MSLLQIMKKFQENVILYKKQDYHQLKKHHREEHTLFIDPTFPAIDSVIGTSSIPPNIHWKRPGDLSASPRLFVDIETSRTVRPGELSCNWIVSACAVLAGVPEIRNRVILDYWDQEWDSAKPELYCGLFHFQFWRFGQWVDVVVDDLLPTVDNTLLTLQGGAENEFWAALVEKAYAKLHGSYDALREGHLCDALVDFTGGVSEVVDIQAEEFAIMEDKRIDFFNLLLNEIANHSLMCFTVMAPTDNEIGSRTPLGLFRGHAYHVTDVRRVRLAETNLRTMFKGREKASMIRLRDPRDERRRPATADSGARSGSDVEFAFSAASVSRMLSQNSDWAKVKECERERLGLVFRDKSEFWMPLEDVVSQFTELTICRLLSRNLFICPGRKWREAVYLGEWQSGMLGTSADRSGGAGETMLRNPQYVCDFQDEEEIVVQLMQFHDQERMEIEPVEENRAIRLHRQWPHCPTIINLDHKRRREVVYRGSLTEGRYVVIPTTFKPGEHAGYLLRIFSHRNIHLRELKEDFPKCPLSCVTGEFQWVTVIKIIRAESLTRINPSYWQSSKLNPYCVIVCESKKGKTPPAKNDFDPVWNNSFVFYRKNVDKPLKLKVYNHNTILPDELLGQCELPALVTHSPTPLSAILVAPVKQKQNDDETQLPSSGTLHLSVLTEDNLMAV
ncbi:calpain-5-like isoform X2 [Lycorma delicatula]|uniref:calpain-5-like isoform X2 n=1 Tax=Lycorma delicatula TaxID=130591 RepID=UPI003F510FB9